MQQLHDRIFGIDPSITYFTISLSLWGGPFFDFF